MQPDFKKIQKVLVIRLSSLGDILLTTPLVRSLKAKYPHVEIHFLLREQYAGIYKHNPHISRLIYYSESPELTAGLLKENYDLVIDLQSNFRSARITAFLDRPYTRFKKSSVRKFLLVNLKVNMLRDFPPIPERYCEPMEGCLLDGNGLEFHPDPSAVSPLEKGKEYICFCPGSRHFTKMWPPEYFIEFGAKLTAQGKTVILLGGASDKEICANIASQIPGSMDLSGRDDISEMAANMKMCQAAVCNDSGLMHLACALNIPVLVFFGSTVKELGFTPYKNKSIILEDNTLKCRPCSHIGRSECPMGHFKCMRNLTPSIAEESLMKIISS